MTFKKTCGRCEKELKENEEVYCKDCEEFRHEIKTFNCVIGGKLHKRTESLDWNYQGKCRKCFYENYNSYKTPKKILED